MISPRCCVAVLGLCSQDDWRRRVHPTCRAPLVEDDTRETGFSRKQGCDLVDVDGRTSLCFLILFASQLCLLASFLVTPGGP